MLLRRFEREQANPQVPRQPSEKELVLSGKLTLTLATEGPAVENWASDLGANDGIRARTNLYPEFVVGRNMREGLDVQGLLVVQGLLAVC